MLRIYDYLKDKMSDYLHEEGMNYSLNVRIGADWHRNRYIQVIVPNIPAEIHYEYINGFWELHFENEVNDATADGIRELCKKAIKSEGDYRWHRWFNRTQGRLRYEREVNNANEFIEGFHVIHNMTIKILLQNNIDKTVINNSFETKSVIANVISVGELLQDDRLRIPPYQRPYEWSTENVSKLIDDIINSCNEGKQRYRIGTVILHNNIENSTMDIVDGQQRLTTLVLISLCSNLTHPIGLSSILKYRHKVSEQHIRENYSYIFNHYNCSEIWNYILEKCEFVKIVVDNTSEAFQMFDTQNGRGKPLKAYNLLKAYHIRAMEQNSYEEKVLCDKRWESAAQYDPTPQDSTDSNEDLLEQLFQEQLYRSRVWSRKDAAGWFSNKRIDEFKGFTIDRNHSIDFPFQNPQLLQYLTRKFYDNVLKGTTGTKGRFISGDIENIDPFANINQPIVNGKLFFDYIETYVEIYKRMFIELGSYQLSEFKKFFLMYCIKYDNKESMWDIERMDANNYRHTVYESRRTGDACVREIYKSLCFVLFDKFGEKVFLKYYETLYKLAYSIRLTKVQIDRTSVSIRAIPIPWFNIISKATKWSDLYQLERCWNNIKENMDIDDPVNRSRGKVPEIVANKIIGENKWHKKMN